MQHTFSVLFSLQTHKINKKNGEAPIWARVTVDGKRAEISTGKKTSPDKWNVNSGRIRGNTEEARTINSYLNKMIVKLEKIFDQLNEDNQYISSATIKNIF